VTLNVALAHSSVAPAHSIVAPAHSIVAPAQAGAQEKSGPRAAFFMPVRKPAVLQG
jgi:hypothetical protein